MENEFLKIEKSLLEERLTKIRRLGIQLYLEGYPASPHEIAASHYVREEQTYMPDWVIDDGGKWIEMHFNKI